MIGAPDRFCHFPARFTRRNLPAPVRRGSGGRRIPLHGEGRYCTTNRHPQPNAAPPAATLTHVRDDSPAARVCTMPESVPVLYRAEERAVKHRARTFRPNYLSFGTVTGGGSKGTAFYERLGASDTHRGRCYLPPKFARPIRAGMPGGRDRGPGREHGHMAAPGGTRRRRTRAAGGHTVPSGRHGTDPG